MNLYYKTQSYLRKYNYSPQLKIIGLDVRDASLSPETMRKDLTLQYNLKRYLDERGNRLFELAQDRVLRHRYFDQRKALLDKMFENEDAYYNEINKRIEKMFEEVNCNIKIVLFEANGNYSNCK